MKFTDLTCCPFCGYDEFYTLQQIRGHCKYNERFDGEEAENYEMHDYLVYSGGNKAYCCNCHKYLGNRTKDTVSLEVEKYFKRNGV